MFNSIGKVSAQELSSPSASATESSKISYQLAYPGLLPDHPLYFLKTTRDRIVSFFTSNPQEKAKFNLLQADKRVESSYLLTQKGDSKIDLAQSTFSKAENYYEEAINNTISAKSQGANIKVFAERMYEANQKHHQVLEDIRDMKKGKYKKKFSVEHERLKGFEKKVKELKR